jgi:DNA polymerase
MFGSLKATYAGSTMMITLPSDRLLCYYGFAIGADKEITYLSAGNETKKLYGSKLAQNIIQATARDILVEVIYKLEATGYPIMFHVHDAVICLAEEAEASDCQSAMVAAWRTVPAWISRLVLDAEGKIERSIAGL